MSNGDDEISNDERHSEYPLQPRRVPHPQETRTPAERAAAQAKVPPIQIAAAPHRSDDPLGEPITESFFIPATKRDVKTLNKVIRNLEVKTVVGIVVVSLGTIFGAWRVVLSDARAEAKQIADAGVVPLEKRVVIVEQTLGAVLSEIREMRIDQREAYKAERDNRRSPRLEQPPPPIVSLDGGR